MKNLFIKGDAFKLIKDIPDNSIDLILTDPPYDKTQHIRTGRLTNGQKLFMAKEFFRVLKKSGSIFMFVGMTDKFDWYNALSKFFKFKSEIQIVYGAGKYSRIFIKNFAPAHESALFFVKTDKHYWKSRKIVPTVFKVKRSTKGMNVDYIGIPDADREKIGVTPKPLTVVMEIVDTLCPENGTVLDPFAGSGTTAIACKLTKRNYICFEINEDIYKFALNRIKQVNGLCFSKSLDLWRKEVQKEDV